jgi:hypothetical protein
MTRSHYLGFIIAMSVGASVAWADDQDNARQGTKYHLVMGQTYNRMAGVHARVLTKYAAAGKQVPADVIKEHAAAIGVNVEAAKKSFAKLAKAGQGTPGVDKRVAEMQERLDKVSQQLKQLEAQVAKERAESSNVLSQVKVITTQLKANDATATQVDKESYDSDSSEYYQNPQEGLGDFWRGPDDAQESLG